MYSGIFFIGPGRNNATITLMSLILFGFKSIKNLVIASPFNWNKPAVSPLANISNVFLSSSGIFSISIFLPSNFSTRSVASARIAKFLIPRKSNFNKPASSIAYISYWVIILPSPFGSYWSGVYSISGWGAMTTPAA